MNQEIASWILGGIFLLFHLWAFIWGPDELPPQKHKFLALSAALLAGFLAFFLSGSIALDANPDLPQLGKTSIQAGSGFALFLIVLGWWKSDIAPISQKGLHRKLDKIIEQNEEIQKALVNLQPPVESVQETNNPFSEEERMAYETQITELEQTEREASEKYNYELERWLETQLSYAGVLLREAKYKEAEAVYRGLMEAHPKNSSILNGLFVALYTEANFQKAEPLIKRAIEIDEETFGPDHLNVARDLNNLAQLLQATNRLDQAEALMHRVLKIGEDSFGLDYPNVAIHLNNLAGLFKTTNRFDEASKSMKILSGPITHMSPLTSTICSDCCTPLAASMRPNPSCAVPSKSMRLLSAPTIQM